MLSQVHNKDFSDSLVCGWVPIYVSMSRRRVPTSFPQLPSRPL